MMDTVEMASHGMIYIPLFTKISTGIQAISRISLSNLNGCKIGITDGKELYIVPLRWAQVA
jgi:hypothetical protein